MNDMDQVQGVLYKMKEPEEWQIITRRLAILYISKCAGAVASWQPAVHTMYSCYQYIYERVIAKEDITDSYYDFFMSCNPSIIMSEIGMELSLYTEKLKIARKH